MLLVFGVGLAVYFMLASVITSYIVYDASDLYKLNWWPTRCFPESPSNGVLVHAGFDASSPTIRRKYPEIQMRVLDFFDSRVTTETSIQRAPELNPTAVQERIRFDSWPVNNGSQDAVFAIIAAHELRKDNERKAFFAEARRVLNDNGRVIVIEQLRDVFNFACFGIAALHFLPRTTWLRSFRTAGLAIKDEFKITPLLTAFVLVRPSTQP